MSVSVAMKAHLALSATYLCHLIRIEERPRELLCHWSSSSRVSVLARGGNLKATAANGGAFSTHGLTADGYLKFTARLNGTIYCGLSTTNANALSTSIHFAIRVDADGAIKVYESGALKATAATTARAGDWFYVKRAATTNAVSYYHNRALIYTSASTSSSTLFADSSIATVGATIENAALGTTPAVIRVTDHTRSLTYGGEVYPPRPLLPTRFNRSEGLKPDNAELTYILEAAGVTETAIRGGRWDYARWEFITVNYLDLTMGPAQHAKGKYGEYKIDNGHFVGELRALSQPLSQPLGQIVSALCDVRRLGDERCGLPLDDYMHDGNVAAFSSSTPLSVTVDLSPAKSDDYFQYGLIAVLSGDNKYYEREIKSNVGNVLTLQRPFPADFVVGDDVTILAGCNRTLAKCQTFVNPDNPSTFNTENFQGSPFSPGSSIYQFPS